MKITEPVKVSGLVTRFKGNGRRLGYPTANLTTETNIDDGVYFGYADLATWHKQPAIIFVGVPTTVGDTVRRVEVHLLDIPDQDYYDQMLNVDIRYFHRTNQTFDSIERLLEVMKDDEVAARAWFAESN
ncbi:MAG: riboflavin kinase [Patescibacteria group bacterium]